MDDGDETGSFPRLSGSFGLKSSSRFPSLALCSFRSTSKSFASEPSPGLSSTSVISPSLTLPFRSATETLLHGWLSTPYKTTRLRTPLSSPVSEAVTGTSNVVVVTARRMSPTRAPAAPYLPTPSLSRACLCPAPVFRLISTTLTNPTVSFWNVIPAGLGRVTVIISESLSKGGIMYSSLVRSPTIPTSTLTRFQSASPSRASKRFMPLGTFPTTFFGFLEPESAPSPLVFLPPWVARRSSTTTLAGRWRERSRERRCVRGLARPTAPAASDRHPPER
mmetsp:Transcript_29125/g.71052  ORF Transcript_29125/g.71052 Transcript_29125/m.71052 type:complete len:278 (+) Transcript_29125:258-1091(+)